MKSSFGLTHEGAFRGDADGSKNGHMHQSANTRRRAKRPAKD